MPCLPNSVPLYTLFINEGPTNGIVLVLTNPFLHGEIFCCLSDIELAIIYATNFTVTDPVVPILYYTTEESFNTLRNNHGSFLAH